MTTSTERDERIVTMASEGMTLAAIGAEFGLTRERVRQILKEQGTRTLRHDDRIHRAAANWRASGRVRDAADVLREHDLAVNTRNLAMIRRAVPELNLPPSKGAHSTWTEDAIVAAVRSVALRAGIDPATGWLTIKQYARLRDAGDPATATIGSNYLWSAIVEQAGFDRRNAPNQRGRRPGTRPKQFTEEQIDRAVLDYLRHHSHGRLGAASLEEFLRSSPQHPSMATVRNRFRARGVNSIPGIFTDVQARLG